MRGFGQHSHLLSGIPATSAAGWLATLGLLGLCANRGETEPPTLRWGEERIGWPVPVLSCQYDEKSLVSLVVGVLHELPRWTTCDHWSKLSLTGDSAVAMAARVGIRDEFRSSKEGLPGLFCRTSHTAGKVGLTELLGGVTSQVTVKGVVRRLAKLVDEDDVRSTLFGPWRPKFVAQGASLGLDWMTVSDGSRAGGKAGSLPSRDLLALLGSTWIPRAPTEGALVWACWSEQMEPAEVSVLATSRELWRLGMAVIDQRPSRSRRGRDSLARTLRAWSVTHVMVGQSTLRSTHERSNYRLWPEAKVLDLRALR